VSLLSRRRHSVKPKFILILSAVFVAAFCFVLNSQENKLREIKTEQRQLTDELRGLKAEEERTQRMIEYSKTDEYLIQYAREKLGLVMPGDILFDMGDE
jgi:cell division protein FtsB